MSGFLLLSLLVACEGGDDAHSHHDDSGVTDSPRELETAGGRYTVAWTPDPDPIPLSDEFSLHISATPADGGAPEGLTLAVDATMPGHGHGMNTVPVVTEDEPGSFTVTGMSFHMPGHWELVVTVTDGAGADPAVFDIVL